MLSRAQSEPSPWDIVGTYVSPSQYEIAYRGGPLHRIAIWPLFDALASAFVFQEWELLTRGQRMVN